MPLDHLLEFSWGSNSLCQFLDCDVAVTADIYDLRVVVVLHKEVNRVRHVVHVQELP